MKMAANKTQQRYHTIQLNHIPGVFGVFKQGHAIVGSAKFAGPDHALNIDKVTTLCAPFKYFYMKIIHRNRSKFRQILLKICAQGHSSQLKPEFLRALSSTSLIQILVLEKRLGQSDIKLYDFASKILHEAHYKSPCFHSIHFHYSILSHHLP